jgi:acyl-CoA synthetase (AMP-forming)/AMP-acid ligase II
MAEQHRPRFGKPDAARLAGLDSPDDCVVRVTWSSGSTGGIKGSPMTRVVQAHRLAMRRAQRGFGPRTRYFTGMPFSPASGYAPPLAVLSAGGAVILPIPGMDFIGLANAFGVTVTSGGPAMLADLVGSGGNLRGRLDTMEFFQVVGAPLSSKLAREARLALTPNIWIGYGSTEIDGVALADSTLCIIDPTAAGFVTPWVDAEIVDLADRPLRAGSEGRLRLRGAHMVIGYFRDEAASRANFRDGWFYPGDIAVITDQGLLRIIGRAEDVIVRDGVGLSPRPIEEVIRGQPGVRDVAVFPLTRPDGTQEICAALVLEPGVDAASIRAAAAAKLGDQAPTRVLVVDGLPRNANGKVARRALVDLAQRAIAP